MLHLGLPPENRVNVCAVGYLNTLPLVWGMLYGEQRDVLNVTFSSPAQCAAQLESGSADLGLVPVAELERLGLSYFPHLGIACDGAVRSILLISKVPFAQIRTLAVDSNSRTSVMLARVILSESYATQPILVPRAPELSEMLAEADACLIIGDPALRLDPKDLPYHVLDLGEAWKTLTGLPMVFAVWAGKPAVLTETLRGVLTASYEFGRSQVDRMLGEGPPRGVEPDLLRRYLTGFIHYEIGPRERRGLELFQTKVNSYTEVNA